MLANAAALDWQYTSTKAEYEAGYQVYVMLGATAKTDWESVSAIQNSSDLLGTGSVTERGSRTKSYLADGKINDDDLTKTSSYYYLIVNGDQYKASTVYSGTNIYDPAAQESSPGTATLSSAQIANTSWSSFGGGGTPDPGPTPGPGPNIPEPTSGLLLLVGGAMLALRRKQK